MPPFRDLFPSDFRVVRRKQWGALDPKSKGKYAFPLSFIYTSYTKTSKCVAPDNCTKELLFIQHLHMKQYPDIKYNFLISHSGDVFEGRGWLAKPTLPVEYKDLQYTSLHIGYIGLYKDHLPNRSMLKAKEKLIKYGITMNMIDKKVLDFDLEGRSLFDNDGLQRYYDLSLLREP